MAASRARWLVTASRTGRGGKAEPALLKWRTLATPGVSDLSNGTSGVICLSHDILAKQAAHACRIGPTSNTARPIVVSILRHGDCPCRTGGAPRRMVFGLPRETYT